MDRIPCNSIFWVRIDHLAALFANKRDAGTGVFINVAKNVNSGIFSVTILSDKNTTVGSTIEIDAYATSTESSCGIGFAKVGLSPSTYTLVVDILGVSPQASSDSVGTFELLDFV